MIILTFNVWASYFVGNFKNALWNSTQNILPIQWEICIVFTEGYSTAIRFETAPWPPKLIQPHGCSRPTRHTTLHDPPWVTPLVENNASRTTNFMSKYIIENLRKRTKLHKTHTLYTRYIKCNCRMAFVQDSWVFVVNYSLMYSNLLRCISSDTINE